MIMYHRYKSKLIMKILIGIYLLGALGNSSKYPINRIANEKLSKTVIAFNISLCSVNTRKIIEVALKSKKWKKAMENNYGTNVHFHEERK